MEKPKRGTILSDLGRPLNSTQDSVHDLNLPPGTQALIEQRLNSAVDRMRELNSLDVKQIAQDYAKRWKGLTKLLAVFAAGSIAGNIYAIFFTPKKAREYVATYIRERVAEPAMRETLTEVAREKAAEYVDNKLRPLQETAAALETRIAAVNADVGKMHATLSEEQTALKLKLRLQELNIAAKLGASPALEELEHVSQSAGPGAATAQILIKDVHKFFEADRHLIAQVELHDAVSRERIEVAVDEAAEGLKEEESGHRSACANALYRLARPSSVRPLCEAIAAESNLAVLARMTRALAHITKEEFEPLDKAAVARWWQSHQSDEKFACPFDKYAKSLRLFYERVPSSDKPNSPGFRLEISPTLASGAIPTLREIVKAEPKAHVSRTYLCFALAATKQFEDAENELAELKTSGHRFVPVASAVLAMMRGKSDAAADALKSAENSTEVMLMARRLALFAPLASDERIKWRPD